MAADQNKRRLIVVGCLVFSGLASLVYELIWTRLLGFAFGTTTEAIGTVLAIFFAGMALGNWIAARHLGRVERPIRVYALLELGIGVFALLSLPLLRNMDLIYAWLGPDHSPLTMTGIRLVAGAIVLLPPTMAMGATLPIVARAIVADDSTLGRWSGILYAANTAGAVLGAYLCGFWMIPFLGLTLSVLLAGGINLAVALAAWHAAGELRAPPVVQEQGTPLPSGSGLGVGRARPLLLLIFGLSGFAAIGIEIIWSKLFGLVMEGTLYGFSTVLSVYLLGIALGSLAITPYVDRIRDLPRAFSWLHIGIASTVALGFFTTPYLPYFHTKLGNMAEGIDAVHLYFVLVTPILLLPTLGFGAAFPIFIRIYTRQAAGVGRGIGIAVAVNTAGSILASLMLSFWWIPTVGMSSSTFILLLIELGIGLTLLLRFQSGSSALRLKHLVPSTLILLILVGSYAGVHPEKIILGRGFKSAPSLLHYQNALDQGGEQLAFVREGKNTISTVLTHRVGRSLYTNGMPEAGVNYAPPYSGIVTSLLGALPYLAAEDPQRALVVGLGGGRTVQALLETGLREVTVVELEDGVRQAMEPLYEGLISPLEDPRVNLLINDARNELLRARYRKHVGYDIIASQPSHPWLAGAANLFTEDFFHLVRENLSDGGVFSLWLNGFRIDPETLIAVIASFERVFPGAVVMSGEVAIPHTSVILLGSRSPVYFDRTRTEERISEPRLNTHLAGLFKIETFEQILAYSLGPASAFAAIDPDAANTDDNAFVETRIPRLVQWRPVDLTDVYQDLAADAAVLPPVSGELDHAEVARIILESSRARASKAHGAEKLRRFLRAYEANMDPVVSQTLLAQADLTDSKRRDVGLESLRQLKRDHPTRLEPLRALAQDAFENETYAEAAAQFERAFGISGEGKDAFAAGKSLYRIDSSRAWPWFERVQSEQDEFPALAFYSAVRALEENAGVVELQEHFSAMRSYRDLQGRNAHPEVHLRLAQLARALGNEKLANAYRETHYRALRARAAPHQKALVQALESRDLPAAQRAFAKFKQGMPADPGVPLFEASLAALAEDPQGFERAILELRELAPNLRQAVGIENKLRSDHELPLLPQRPVEEFAERPQS